MHKPIAYKSRVISPVRTTHPNGFISELHLSEHAKGSRFFIRLTKQERKVAPFGFVFFVTQEEAKEWCDQWPRNEHPLIPKKPNYRPKPRPLMPQRHKL
jgi:hypothetical protein